MSRNLLQTRIRILKLKAKVLGYELRVVPFLDPVEPQIEAVVLLQNKSRPINIGAIGISKEDERGGQELTTFLINIKKWKWAEAEGFSLADMVDKENLKDEIFIPVKFSELPEKLK